ncbi:hypothetical protein [Propionivibrio sp.]|uniref:hypothetical protein n=1 Tax=Propionivibrio sp. TaxID=2212460 RepID=UPI0026253034|nr:hypothetical protein [Propionivibrio sp.]
MVYFEAASPDRAHDMALNGNGYAENIFGFLAPGKLENHEYRLILPFASRGNFAPLKADAGMWAHVYFYVSTLFLSRNVRRIRRSRETIHCSLHNAWSAAYLPKTHETERICLKCVFMAGAAKEW